MHDVVAQIGISLVTLELGKNGLYGGGNKTFDICKNPTWDLVLSISQSIPKVIAI